MIIDGAYVAILGESATLSKNVALGEGAALSKSVALGESKTMSKV